MSLVSWARDVWLVLLVDILVLFAMGWVAAHWRAIPERANPKRLAALDHPRTIQTDSLATALPAVNDVVERGIKALDALDRKVAFIPPALGVAASIVLPRVNPARFDVPIVVAAGYSALAAGLLALLAAMAVLYPRFYKAGADPVNVALRTHDQPLEFRQGITNALARSAVNIQGLIVRKADLFLLSVVGLAATIALTAIFGVNGGFISGTTGGA